MHTVPLLVARRDAGFGPRVPIRNRFVRVRVEGLASDNLVGIEIGDATFAFRVGAHEVKIEKGISIRARIYADNPTPVSCWLENE